MAEAVTVSVGATSVPVSFGDGTDISVTFPTPTSITVSFAEQGPAGQGVPSGGVDNALLQKASTSDYDTEWSTTLDTSDITIDGGLI